MAKVSIEEALQRVEILYSSWNIAPEDWRLAVCGWAFRLQGYEVTGDLETIDTMVLRSSLPWTTEEIKMTFPPRDPGRYKLGSPLEAQEAYTKVITETGFDVHIHLTPGEELPPGLEYKLPNERIIYLESLNSLIKTYAIIVPINAADPGQEGWLQEHLRYLQEIAQIAQNKGDICIAEECRQIIQQYAKV